MQHYYTTTTYCAGSSAEYIMLRIFDSKREQVRVRTGRKWSYINLVIREARLKPLWKLPTLSLDN